MKNIILACAMTVATFTLSHNVLAAAPAHSYSVDDTIVGDLLDNPTTRGILDKYMPGFSNSDKIDMARGLTLKAIQPYAPDLVTDDALTKINAELAKVPAEK
jgi:hypothetical protein